MGKNNNFRTNNNNATSFSAGESYNLGVTIGGLQKEIESLRHELEELKKELPEKIERQASKSLEAQEKDRKSFHLSKAQLLVAVLAVVVTIVIGYIQLTPSRESQPPPSSQISDSSQADKH